MQFVRYWNYRLTAMLSNPKFSQPSAQVLPKHEAPTMKRREPLSAILLLVFRLCRPATTRLSFQPGTRYLMV